jgi:hypothetical protein
MDPQITSELRANNFTHNFTCGRSLQRFRWKELSLSSDLKSKKVEYTSFLVKMGAKPSSETFVNRLYGVTLQTPRCRYRDNRSSSDRMTSEWSIGKDLEGSGPGCICLEGTRKTPGWVTVFAEIRTEHLRTNLLGHNEECAYSCHKWRLGLVGSVCVTKATNEHITVSCLLLLADTFTRTQNYNLACSSAWVWNLVSVTKRRKTEGVWEQSAEKISTNEESSTKRLEKIT